MASNNQKIKAKKAAPASPHHLTIAGIGASAGGLDAFKALIKAIPNNSGIAWVLVQHQHPAYESKLTDLLQKVTNIPVTEITNDVLIKPNIIYVMPANKMLTIKAGKLKLSPRPTKDKIQSNYPINLFFTSLALAYEANAVGVVLSGTASDGTKGLKAIKDHGGITFAQNIESAGYPGMPESAIKAGVVDFELSPDKIPRKLQEIKKIIGVNQPGVTKSEDDENYFKEILSLLHIHKNVDFTYYKQTTIRRRILRRMVLNKFKKIAEYTNYLKDNKAEIGALYQDMLIPVTSFFRDEKVFDNLCETVFPALIKNKQADGLIRIWISGCSTGEEAYSIAICFKEYLGIKKEKVQIFATDLSEPAIAKARTGIYSKADAEVVSHHRLAKYFNLVHGNYQVKKELRDMCVFAVHNFLKDPPFSKIDFISCRNVLIYMDTYLQKKALSTFHYALNSKGLLMLGKSENTIGITDLFIPVNKNDKIFIRKEVPAVLAPVTARYIESKPSETKKGFIPETLRTDFQKKADDLLLAKFTPATVVVNEALDIVYFRGNTIFFLQQSTGKPTHNLLKLAKLGLAFELKNILHKSKKLNKAVKKENIPVQSGKNKHLVTIEVIPLTNIAEPHWVITFEKQKVILDKNISAIPSPKNSKKADWLPFLHLEEEVTQLREDMRIMGEEQEASNEELQSTNEELLSSNEELQSLNEELETSKEELQSTVEELTVVNQEMINLNEQLATEKEYAEAIIATIPQPMLVLDKNLRVTVANQQFYEKFLVTENNTEDKLVYDIGNGQWDIPELRILLEAILPEKESFFGFEVEHTFQSIGHRIMRLNAREIIRDKAEKLILLAIEDITNVKEAAKKIEQSEEKFKAAVAAVEGIVWTNNAKGEMDGEQLPWSQLTGQTFEEYKGFGWANVVHPDDAQPTIDAWNEAVKKQSVFIFEHRLKVKDNTWRQFSIRAIPLKNSDGSIREWVGVHTDITEKRNAEIKIKESAEQFTNLADNISQFAWMADEKGYRYWYNQRWYDYTGTTFEEMQGLGWQKMHHPEHVDRVVKKMQHSWDTGDVWEDTFPLRSKEGEYRWFLSRAVPIKNEAGNVVRWFGTNTDITEQRELIEKLDGSVNKLRLYEKVIVNTKEAVLITEAEPFDLPGPKIVYVNDAFCEMTGYTPEEVIGKTPRILQGPKTDRQQLDKIKAAQKKWQAVKVELVNYKKNGEEFYVEFEIVPVADEKGWYTHWVSVQRDVTERKNTERELQQLATHLQLSTTSASVGTWLYNIETGTLEWSALHKRMWGYDENRTDLLFDDWHIIIHTNDKEACFSEVEAARVQKRQYEVDYRIIRANDGELRWMKSVGQYYYNKKGEAVSLTGVSMDITDAKMAEEKLVASEERLRLATQTSGIGIWQWNVITNQIRWDVQMFSIYGATPTPDGLIDYTTWSKAVVPEDIAEQEKILQDTVKNIGSSNRSFKILRANDGILRYIEAIETVRTNAAGEAEWVVGTNMDVTERKEAEKHIKESEERFRKLADEAPMWVWLTDMEVNILYANEALLQFVGIASSKEFTGKVWEKIVHPDDISVVYRNYNEAAARQASFNFECRIWNAVNGKYEWMFLNVVARYEGKEFKGFIGTALNVDEQKSIMSQLEYRKALLEAHNEASVDGILLVDTKGKILSYNHRFVEIWNMPQHYVDSKDDEGALSFALTQLVNPDQFIEKVKWLYDHPDEISVDELEFKDGKIIQRHGYPVTAPDGSYYAWSWMFRDITEQRTLDKTIKESEKRFRLLANSMPQHIWTANADGNLNYFNQSVFDYSGLSLEQINKLGWMQIVHPDDREENIKQWTKSVTTGKDFLFEHRFKKYNGEYRWQLSRALPQRDAEGNITMWVGSSTDIQNLKEEEQRKSDFIKMVSHELKTPVTSIKGYVQLLLTILEEEGKTDLSGMPLKTSLGRIDKQVVRLTRLITEMLDLSRLEVGKLDLKHETFRLNDLVTESVQDIMHTSAAHKIEIQHDFNGNVYGDKDRIQQVVINFINNAIKYSPDNNNIQVKVFSPDENHIAVSVKDYGIGINKKDHQKIFERFYRAEGNNENSFSGFGIGLFIANEIIQRHKGQIKVESEEGQGSVFTFILSLATEEATVFFI